MGVGGGDSRGCRAKLNTAAHQLRRVAAFLSHSSGALM